MKLVPAPSPTIPAAWAALVAADPAAPALVDAATEATWSRADLDRQARAVRSQLPDDFAGRRLLIALPNGPGWLSVFLGTLQAGAVPVPVDPTEAPAAHARIAAAIGAAALWSPAGLQPLQVRRRPAPATHCLIKLTSGSTGTPRALVFTHAQMLADAHQVCATMGITPADLNLAVIPLGHSYGLGNLTLPLLAHGTPLLFPRAPLPRLLANDSARWQATVFPAVPPLLRLLADSDLPSNALGRLRLVISAGAPLAPDTARAFHARFGLAPHGFYGSSETGGISYDRTGQSTLTGESVGQPLVGVRLTPARAGRLWVESPAVFTLANRHRSPAGLGRHRPADRIEILPTGELALRGRTGRLVKIAGRRLDLGELESALRAIEGVTDAWAMPHPAREDQIAAAIATREPEPEIRRRLVAALPAWKIPRRLLILPRFPVTPRGKPDPAALRALFSAGLMQMTR